MVQPPQWQSIRGGKINILHEIWFSLLKKLTTQPNKMKFNKRWWFV
jgi:hypothetical protein